MFKQPIFKVSIRKPFSPQVTSFIDGRRYTPTSTFAERLPLLPPQMTMMAQWAAFRTLQVRPAKAQLLLLATPASPQSSRSGQQETMESSQSQSPHPGLLLLVGAPWDYYKTEQVVSA